MSDDEIRDLIIQGDKKKCPMCNNEKFYRSTALLNTAGMTFLGLDRMNNEAVNYICANCTHILWFYKTPSKYTEKEIAEQKKENKEKKKDGWWIN